ncbi:uncharacterized protein SCHCODRAFT_02617396 [Schizophyllum commune H4-8]|uniref:uncharacterized protein n=1 Tax=Schizophyllum commune (strain H4-8 / FGSC 9210) TaxID=578458 RepID=UPI0021600671|nr:uncharacterized protein SCHCODRAFT_02617396 [Schizophyllum commune H4-8]KAI5894615.1 hypothetical protein SCHCODRAFT_02617396 [Schizophyllum commune H4-8]
MPEDLRWKWSAAIAAQPLGPAFGATTRRSPVQDQDFSRSLAYESGAPALRTPSLVRRRQYQCYGEDVLRLHPRARKTDGVA